MRVIASGRLRQRSYQDRDGNNRTAIELEVDEIGPSIRYATAQVTRAASTGTQSTAGASQASPDVAPEGTASWPAAMPGSGATSDAWYTPGTFGDDTPF
jgi:single-strand DNA-binding protein